MLADDTPQIHVGVCQADQCMDAVNYIFVNILIFSPAVEPFQKRPRFDDTSNELCRAYIAKRRTWEGRRLKRRQIMRECSALSNDSIALEEAVSCFCWHFSISMLSTLIFISFVARTSPQTLDIPKDDCMSNTFLLAISSNLWPS